MFITNKYTSFHLRWREKLVEYQKTLKHHDHDCRCKTLINRWIPDNAYETEINSSLELNINVLKTWSE